MKEKSVEYILEYTKQFIEDVKTHKRTGQKRTMVKTYYKRAQVNI